MLADKNRPAIERLRAHFDFMASRHAQIGFDKGCLIGNLAAEISDNTPLLREAIGQSLAKWTETVAATIREGQTDGSIAAGLDAEQMARVLVNSWEGAVVRMKIARSREPLDDFLTVVFPLLAGPGTGVPQPA